MNRKQRRAAAKAAKKGGDKELSEKIFLFEQMPDECSACIKPFDKKDKEMVKSWNVVVREQEESVKVYCPNCWNNAIKLLEEFGVPIKNERQNY